MKRRIGIRSGALLLAMLGVLANAAPAAAIMNGKLDYGEHPNVGLLAAVIPGEGLSVVCSGTLIAPRVFLTAGHCTGYLESVGLDWALVTFDAQARASSRFYAGAIVTHPGFAKKSSDAADLGVVLLNRAVDGIEPARLPTAGLLDEMKDRGALNGQHFTAVGYGAIGSIKAPGGRIWYSDFARRNASSDYRALNGTRLHMSQNPSHGDGGTCYGDSGGPNFIGTSDVIAAVTMTGDSVCRATGVAYRVDTETARTFLGNFVELP